MAKNNTFKDNQQYLAEFFNLLGAQKRRNWYDADSPGSSKKLPRKGEKDQSEAQKVKEFQAKVKSSLGAGVSLPLEGLAKKHKLSFPEKSVLAYYAGVELYRGHADLGTVIQRFEEKGIAPAFETARLVGPTSPLIRKKLILPMEDDIPLRGESQRFLPPDVFSLITGLELRAPAKTAKPTQSVKLSSPTRLYDCLSGHVVGQEEAKKAVAAGVFLHFKRVELNAGRKPGEKLAKSNILIIGPTGCGKTHICRTLAGELQVPFHITDATQYTETGYVGKNVDDMVLDLFKDQPQGTSSGGIIYLDEVDKIAAMNGGRGHYGDRDVSGKSVQEELLRMLEGTEVSCERQRSMGRARVVDISSVLFIAGGAFQGLEDIIEERLRKRSIGFRGGAEPPLDRQELLRHVMPEDLVAYGFMPEFIGRFPVLAVLNRLTKADLVKIISGTKNSLMEQYMAVIEKSGLDIEIPEELAERVAEEALKRDLGARAIRAIMEKWLMEELFRRGASPEKGVSGAA